MTRTRGLVLIIIIVFMALIGLTIGVLNDASGLRANVQAIQQNRISLVTQQCRDQNRKHRKTIHELDVLIRRAERGVSRKRREAIRASRASTVLLIDAFEPHRNCRLVVDRVRTDP